MTNVGAVALAAANGTDNRLSLTNGASLFCESMSLGGSTRIAQRSVVSVTEGSRLSVAGDFAFTTGSAREAYSLALVSGNALEVSGEGSGVSVAGVMSLGKLLPNDTVNGSVGGNRLSVADGATADIATLQVGHGNCHGQSNRVEFARGAKVDIGQTLINSCNSTVVNRRGENEFHVLDGAVVTNAGQFVLGFKDDYSAAQGFYPTGNYGNRLVVSNATFWTKTFRVAGSGASAVDYMIDSPESAIVVSGADASFAVGESMSRALFNGWDSQFVVENGADVTLDFLGTWKNAFSYTVATSNETLLVRSGATLTASKNLLTGAAAQNGYGFGRNNRIVVESGATLNAKAWLFLHGTGCGLVVDDATANVANSLAVGEIVDNKNGTFGGGTNSYVRIQGTRPSLTVAWSATVTNDSSIVFALPEKGYDEGFATTQKPLVSVSDTLAVSADSRIELTGAAEMQAYRRAQKLKKASYVLIYARKGISLPDGLLESLNASLPDGVSVALSSDAKTLTLTCKPRYGGLVVVR